MGIKSFAQAFRLSKKSGESLVLQSESPPCEGGWRGVSLVGRVFRRLLLSACGGVLNPSVCCADSSPRRGAKLPATSPYRIHDRAEKIESSDTAPICAAPACLQKSLFRQAVKPLERLADSKGGTFGRRPPNNKKAQEGSQNSPVDCFGVGNPRRGFPGAKNKSHNFP